jgi:hypothetical protein
MLNLIDQDQAAAIPAASGFSRNWPMFGIAAAMAVTVAWMGFLGYGLFKLIESAFF